MFDSAGLMPSLGNKIFLRQSMPTHGQVMVWDRYIVRASKRLDSAFGYRLGKSVLGVWQKTLEPTKNRQSRLQEEA